MSRSGAAYLRPGQANMRGPLIAGTWGVDTATGYAPVANPVNGACYYSPFSVPNPAGMTLTGLIVMTTVAATAGGLCRLGVYAESAAGVPGALVVDAGTIDVTVAPGVLEIVTATALPQGKYWLAAAAQGGAGTQATYQGPTVGITVASRSVATTSSVTLMFVTGLTGALPSTAAVNTTGTGAGIGVWARVA